MNTSGLLKSVLASRWLKPANLPRAEPIMYDEDTSAGEVMFRAGDKFYLWNQVSGGVRVIRCRDLNEIVEILNT